MFVVLAVYGCGSPTEVPVVRTVEPAPTPPPELRIATVPDRVVVARAPVLESPLPSGQPIVRRECLGMWDRDEEGQLGGFGGRGGGYGGGGLGSKGTIGSGQAPAASPASAPAAARPNRAGDGGATGETRSARREAPTDVAGGVVAAEPPPAAPSAGGPVVTGALDGHLADKPKLESLGYTEADGNLDRRGDDGRDQRAKQAPSLGWGDTVYLSNDDSMSLASAQRVLYALSRGVQVSPSEVRPHELLNYFSFDSVAPGQGQTFGVLGAAEQSGDTLTMSLAVRGANPARQPLDLTMLVDRSCSMRAEDRMGYTQRGLSLLSGNLQRGDRVDLVLFDSSVCTPLENYVVGRDEPGLLDEMIRQITPTSGTNLAAGLGEAYRVQTARDAASVHGRNRRVLLVTDALLNEGNVDESLVAEVGTHLDSHDIRLSGVGVGREFNDRMLDALTEKGRGAYVYLGSEAVVDRVFGPGFDALVRTVAHDVRFSVDLPESLAMEKFYGEEMSTDPTEVDPIHYHAGTTQLFLQDLKIRDGAVRRDDPVVMRIEYREATTMEPRSEELRTTVGALLDGDPHNLRKAKALMGFADWTLATAMGAEPCGEPLAQYTSAAYQVADDAEIAFVNGLVGTRCKVPLATSVASAGGIGLKVKVDSDIPISSARLVCGGRTHVEALSSADTVASFDGVRPGPCLLELDGTTPMTARIEVPSTPSDLRCLIRGGRVSCS
ncbi:MAG: VWA domain-containing protein [Myxococcota bacterium]